jgi:hypothetical protein
LRKLAQAPSMASASASNSGQSFRARSAHHVAGSFIGFVENHREQRSHVLSLAQPVAQHGDGAAGLGDGSGAGFLGLERLADLPLR